MSSRKPLTLLERCQQPIPINKVGSLRVARKQFIKGYEPEFARTVDSALQVAFGNWWVS